MKKKLLLGLLAAAAVSFTACQKNEVISEMPQDNAIGFGTYVGRDAQTKATVTNLTALQNSEDGFGVFAYFTGTNNYANSTKPEFMYNQKVKYETDEWNYTPLKYWPGNGQKVSFFAYAPYVNAIDAKITALPAADVAADPTIGFTVPTIVTNQIDLLYASVKDASSNPVNFTFNHALTRIGFKVKTAREDYRVNISSITLTGDFNIAGTLNLNTGAWSGEDSEDDTDVYTLNFDNANQINSTTGTAINANEGYVMTIPTDFTSSNLSVSVTYTYEYQVSTGVWAAAVNDTKEGNVAVNFEKGKAYTLLMTLDPLTPITFAVTAVTGWDPADGTDTPVN